MIKEISHVMGESAAFDGRPARVFSISNHRGMSVTLMDIGATGWIALCRLTEKCVKSCCVQVT